MHKEAKAKVVASVWRAKFIQFLTSLAVLPRSIWKKRMNSIDRVKIASGQSEKNAAYNTREINFNNTHLQSYTAFETWSYIHIHIIQYTALMVMKLFLFVHINVTKSNKINVQENPLLYLVLRAVKGDYI